VRASTVSSSTARSAAESTWRRSTYAPFPVGRTGHGFLASSRFPALRSHSTSSCGRQGQATQAPSLLTMCRPVLQRLGQNRLWLPMHSPRRESIEPTETPRPATHTVCANGCDFVTIQAALGDATVGSGAAVEAGDAEHTEAGIVISEGTELTIRGLGAGETIV